MKNFLYILLLALPILGCDNFMSEINKNIDNPTSVDAKYIIPNAIIRTAFSITGGSDFSFYSSLYMEHNVGIFGQFYNGEVRNGEPFNASTTNNAWVSTYANMGALKDGIKRCAEGGQEAGNYHAGGVIKILMAHNLATVTDLTGDVPWSEALQPGVILQPKLDKQEEVYKEVFRLLDEGIEDLEKTTTFSSIGEQDFLYKGDPKKWIKFAYGLKARYTMRLSFRNPQYDKVIDYAKLSFASSKEQAEFKYNGATAQSPFYRFLKDRNYYGSSMSLNEKLEVRNDPRKDKFFAPAKEGVPIVFAPNGNPQQQQGFYGISGISTPTAPTYLLSYHELEFLKAEAYLRKNMDTEAKAAIRKAVVAAFAKVNINLTDTTTVVLPYYEQRINNLSGEDLLKEMQVQKYLSFFEEESIEAYNDYRRWMAMDGDKKGITLKIKKDFPLRFVYGVSDVTTNPNIANLVGDGRYVLTENVWWAGGDNY